MITLEKVSKKFPKSEKYALEDINFNVEKGEFVSIIGRSGAGKSTLVRLLIGDERPTEGNITVDDWNVNMIKHGRLPYFRRNIGVVFQDFKLLNMKTAFENVAFAMEVCGASNKEIQKTVPLILEMVGLKEQAGSFPSELSGGEKQRIALARALIHKPKILIADEPTGNLDSVNSWELSELLLKLNEMGTTVVMVSHNKEIINALGKRVITIEDGKVIKDRKTGKYAI